MFDMLISHVTYGKVNEDEQNAFVAIFVINIIHV